MTLKFSLEMADVIWGGFIDSDDLFSVTNTKDDERPADWNRKTACDSGKELIERQPVNSGKELIERQPVTMLKS